MEFLKKVDNALGCYLLPSNSIETHPFRITNKLLPENVYLKISSYIQEKYFLDRSGVSGIRFPTNWIPLDKHIMKD